MIYGAYGYTGALIAEEAVRRGHRPLLAGRDEKRLRALAERLGLPHRAVGLEDDSALERAVGEVAAVVHAAGPFVHTQGPMLGACLARKVHYLDITGEITVFRNTFRHGEKAREAGIALLSGVGFDVVPTDCLAAYVAHALPGATSLELAFAALGGSSAGTLKTVVEGLSSGGWVRRGGKLVPHTSGTGEKNIAFSHRDLLALPIPWGDLETAWHSTGIGNITVYMAMPRKTVQIIRAAGPAASRIMGWKPLRRAAQAVIARTIAGPDETAREEGRSHVYARAEGPGGFREAWLETAEGYRLTATAAVLAVERVMKGEILGALTPSLAFGADFVLEVPGSQRWDRLPR